MGLGRVRPLTGHRALRHRPLLDWPNRLASDTIEDIGKAGFRDLGHGLDLTTIDFDIDEVRGGGDIVIPDAVMDGLEMPDPFAAFCVQHKQAFGEYVLAMTHATPVIVGRCGDRKIDQSQFIVGGHE